MIFLHWILGIGLGAVFGHWFGFFLGSVIVDIDHIPDFFRIGAVSGKGINLKKIVDATINEEKYGIKSKKKYVHSIFGLLFFTFIFWIFMKQEAVYFAAGYFFHLLLDWPDREVKYFLFPLNIKFKGVLPIWSNIEKKATVIALMLLLAVLYLKFLF